MQTRYTSIKLPVVLAEQIKHIVPMFGFTSVSDFVLDAVRVHLREYNDLVTRSKP